ncbi:MAG: asparagine synthase-related protein, partial [Methanobacteriota archaeon]
FHLHSDDEWSEQRWTEVAALDGLKKRYVPYRPTADDCVAALANVDVPLADASILPTFLVSRAVADAGYKVVLSGDGGDENFAGYDTAFESALRFARLRRRVPLPGARRLLAAAFGLVQRSRVANRGARLLVPSWVRYAGQLENHLRDDDVVPEHADPRINNLIAARKSAPAAAREFRRDVAAAIPSARPDAVERLMYVYYRTYLPSILEKVDRASMANSLEVRVPLLDPDMVDQALRTPLAHKLEARGKYPLKRIAADLFGDAFAFREKRGFSFDWSKLFRDPAVVLRFEEGLRVPGVERYLDGAGVRRLLDENRRGASRGKVLWRAFAFAEWYRNWGCRHEPA